MYYALLVELAKLHEEREEYEPAIEALRQAVAEKPTNEAAHAGLMRLYVLSGRRHEAILQYERMRGAISGELGQEPGVTSQRLYEEIRAGSFPVAPPSPSAAGHPSEEHVDSALHNLPASLTSFVGREREMIEAKRTFSMTRLLSEHLIDAVAQLAEALLRACPTLRILATSREPLGIRGEAVR